MSYKNYTEADYSVFVSLDNNEKLLPKILSHYEKLQDDDHLEIQNQEKFFQIPASEILTNNFLQEKMQMTMNTLCPPGRKLGDLPWLECFIRSYNVRDAMKNQVYYQIFDTTVAEDVV